jgi:hypothetical protein
MEDAERTIAEMPFLQQADMIFLEMIVIRGATSRHSLSAFILFS